MSKKGGKNKEEILVKNILNGDVREKDKKHPLFSIAQELAKEIRKDLINIKICKHVGNKFDDRGDIIVFNSKKQYIELKKITSSKVGKGTLANTSQNILKEYRLVKNVLGWQQWREKNNYNKRILNILNEVRYKDKQKKEVLNKEKLIDPGSEIEIKARIQRLKIKKFTKKHNIGFKSLPALIRKFNGNKKYYSLMDSETKKAVEICAKIINLAREDLRYYLLDCSKKKLNNVRFLKFIILLKSGFHTIPLINKNINLSFKKIKELSNNYRIYYYYTQREKGDKIKKEDFKKIKECFPVNTNALKIKFNNESIWIFHKKKKIMQLKFHWRNVFFGIAVPSVEIFDKLNNHLD